MRTSLSTTVPDSFEATLDATRTALAEQGFGVLTEVDLAGTLKEKIGAEIAPHVILGACRPPLAYAAVQVEPAIGLLLPCNVVVRAIDETHTRVEVLDPETMVTLMENPRLADTAGEAGARLRAALAALTAQTPDNEERPAWSR
jgi:uncharacterized protein (DUF302 family)